MVGSGLMTLRWEKPNGPPMVARSAREVPLHHGGKYQTD